MTESKSLIAQPVEPEYELLVISQINMESLFWTFEMWWPDGITVLFSWSRKRRWKVRELKRQMKRIKATNEEFSFSVSGS